MRVQEEEGTVEQVEKWLVKEEVKKRDKEEVVVEETRCGDCGGGE